MSSPPSSSEAGSKSFELLDERIQRWIWSVGWTALRDAQERAIPPIIAGDRDVIVAAATAAGKTEAAFLPILSRLLRENEEGGSVIYVSPLVALINDQWGRMLKLCEDLEVPVVPWHGDITASQKQKFLKRPSGVLLITPESLEAIFMRRGSSVGTIFGRVRYLVVDELHAFIGTDRGKQLQSLMHRIESALGVRVPRIGLSATLGDMRLAADFLRPGHAGEVEIIHSTVKNQELLIQVRGYIEPLMPQADEEEGNAADPAPPPSALHAIADHLYKTLRGSNNLIYPNSRRLVEVIADDLRRRCEKEHVPNEFWPHHGSLSKELREETERALKAGEHPATAVCTTTLELGIDIGSVKSIAQIGPPPSVASLRQRLGRSGRRAGEPAILRAYCVEDVLTSRSDVSDRLREGLVQTVASVRLLLAGWCEPPSTQALGLSTLVQQVMSVIYERGGIDARDLHSLLVETGPFSALSPVDFTALLRAMGQHDLLTQDSSGLLLLGDKGERLAAHYTFYAAFESDDEWQLVREGHVLGTLPIKSAVYEGLRLIFGGRRWRVTHIDSTAKVITVVADPGGKPPEFDSGRPLAHDGVRQEMRRVLEEDDAIPFLDTTAQQLLREARDFYRTAGLARQPFFGAGEAYAVMTWRGDRVNETLALLLRSLGAASVSNAGLCVHVGGWTADRLADALTDIAQFDTGDTDRLLVGVENMIKGKWDWAVPNNLLRRGFEANYLDMPGAIAFASQAATSTLRTN